MAESQGQILNAEALTEVFGSWPLFHDAEVHRIRLTRSGPGTSPALEADIHLFEISAEVGPDGTYRQDKHILATLLFEGVDQLQLEGFNHQNVLFELAIKDISDRLRDVLRWEVELVSSHGVSARWLCETVSVLEAQPFDPSG